ncbi:tail protein [Rhodococcus phage Trina]|uniref:Minor tail protein n=1 Tax=Rhodococcus phage Trina TaxID=2027905 RepID=A0A2D0ZMZ6_9CAUD|nr:tail protein [Rhodococcus phage Trina]ASZ74899.1 hypothetical protein SEA_TRINA_85 [Rhodococcus phage Trina]
MITTNGQNQLLNIVAGKSYKFADLFVVGASSAVLPVSATALDFPWATTPVLDAFVDTQNQQVLYHGTLPANIAGDINEIGLISLNSEFISTGLPTSLVYSFESGEQWFSDGEFEVTNESSIGANSYVLNNVVADQYLAKLVSAVNISRYDTVKLRIKSTAVTQIKLVMKTDEANYAWKNINLTNGANDIKTTMDTFTKVGTFDAKNIQEIRIVINTVSNATNSIDFDALTLSSDLNGGLVARTVLSVAKFKRLGASMEIEFAVALNG